MAAARCALPSVTVMVMIPLLRSSERMVFSASCLRAVSSSRTPYTFFRLKRSINRSCTVRLPKIPTKSAPELFIPKRSLPIRPAPVFAASEAKTAAPALDWLSGGINRAVDSNRLGRENAISAANEEPNSNAFMRNRRLSQRIRSRDANQSPEAGPTVSWLKSSSSTVSVMTSRSRLVPLSATAVFPLFALVFSTAQNPYSPFLAETPVFGQELYLYGRGHV